MRELKKIYCNKTKDLPTLEVIIEELKNNDRIRIDYNSKFKFLFLKNLKKYIENINQNFNVEIQKGEFKDLKFYNIYSLFSDLENEEKSRELEKAIKSYRLTSEKLILEFEEKYEYSFLDPKKSFRVIRDVLRLDENKLSKNWRYGFHGGDICFSNSKTGQVVDINLKFDGYYGVLDLWFFQYYMETTKEFKSLSQNYKDNTPKLIQTLNLLKEKGKVKSIKSELFDSDKLIWNKKAYNNGGYN